MGILSAAVHLYVRACSPSTYEVFFAGLEHPFAAVGSVVEGLGKISRWNYLLGFGSSLLWGMMSINELKKKSHGGTGTVWLKSILLAIIGTLVAGPGATMAVFWMWREKIMGARQVEMAAKGLAPKI